jgi:hypothetical protein
VDTLLEGSIGDAGGGEADALVDHLDAAIAGGDGDLLGTVAVAVEAGLADQHLEPAAEIRAGVLDLLAHRGEHVLGDHRPGPGDAGGCPVLAENLAQALRPLAGGNTGVGAGDRGRHDVAAFLGRFLELGQGRYHRLRVARGAVRLQALDLLLLGLGVDREEAAVLARGQRRRGGLGVGVDADHLLLAGGDRGDADGAALDEAGLHVAGLDRDQRPAHGVDPGQLLARLFLQGLDLRGHGLRAVEQVGVFQEVGLVGQDLLHPERPLLVPGTRQAERLVPGRELDGARTGLPGKRHGQHLEQDAVDVVLGLRLGEAQRVHLHAVAEQARLLVGDAVALPADLVPELDEGAHLAELGDEADAGVDEEADPAHGLGEVGFGDLAAVTDGVEDGDRGRQRVGQLLHRRRPRLLQMVAADVGGVPLRQLLVGVGDDVGDQPHRGLGRVDVGPAREIFLDDVVLDRALQLLDIPALFLRHRDVEREQPGGGGVDGHRGVHLLEGDALEQGRHVGERGDRHADLADLARGQRVVAVVAGLGRQVEGDREAGLPAREVGAVELVAGLGRAVAGVGAEQPGLVTLHGRRTRRHRQHLSRAAPTLRANTWRRRLFPTPEAVHFLNKRASRRMLRRP